jgi:hypothetical protein
MEMHSIDQEWLRSSACARETEARISAVKPGLFEAFRPALPRYSGPEAVF